MTRDEKYWQARKAQRMWEHMQSAEETADQVAKVYVKASLYLNKEMQDIFKKYVEKHHLTEKEALQLLNTLRDRTSIEELRQRLQSTSQKQELADLLAELEAPAYQVRIQRLQDLQTQIDFVMQQVYRQEQAIATAHYIQLAEEAYNRSVFDIQQRTGLGFSFSHIDKKQVDMVLKSKWSGMNYSERIWRNTRALAQEVKEALLVNLITGRTERETAEMLMKKFAGGSSKARRLIRTESCYLSNQLEMKSYKECGVEKYRYLATLDLRTSEICRELDGKVFLVKDQQPGKNCPPMHPWCRSTTIAVIDEKSLEGMKRKARDPVTGKSCLVPTSMNYREWYEKYVEGNTENTTKKSNDTEPKKIAKENYKSVIDKWKSEATPNSHSIEDLMEYNVSGVSYFVDGKNVKLDYSPKEKWVAELLQKEFGGEIKMVPRVLNPQGISTPDYIFRKEGFDLKELSGTSKNLIYNAISKKGRQASNFILDVSNCPLDEAEIARQIEYVYWSKHTQFIDKIIVIKDGQLSNVYEKIK